MSDNDRKQKFNEIDIIYRLKDIERSIRSQNNTTDELRKIVDELKNIIADMDKSISIQEEKQTMLNYKIKQLQKEVELLDESGERAKSRNQDLVEKTLFVFLGGIVTFLFNMMSKK